MNQVQWISFILVLFSYGDAGDVLTNGTLYASASPCLTARQYSSSGPQEHYNGFCYWHSNYTYVTWLNAEISCRATGSNLASIHSLEELTFLRNLLRGYTDIFWIGLKAEGLFSPFEWSDDTPVDFVNWEDGYSGDPTGRINMCVSLNPTNGFFIPANCRERQLYICKAIDESDANVTVTPTSLNTTVILPQVCPDGWRTFGYKCYAAFGLEGSKKETWTDANQKCLDMGATLVSIHGEFEQEFLFGMMTGKTDMAWIGFRELPTSADRAFHWADDSPVDFTFWDTNQPNNWNNFKEECGNIRFNSPHFGRWNDAHCELEQSYICQMHTDPKNAKFAQDTCSNPEGWIKLGSSCYKIFNGTGNMVTWLEAKYFCSDFGGNLVTVRNLKDSTFLRFHLSDLQDEFWIGLRNERSNEMYAWITGRVQFTNWNRGQPYEFPDQPNCVAINSNGKWVVRSCDDNHPFICEVDEGTSTPSPLEPTEGMACPNTSLKWKDYGASFCYIIELKNRMPWYEAAHRCFQAGGFLASFHSIEEVNAVLNQITDYKDPLFIGLAQTHDGDFVWDDRSVVDFANWLSGRPRSDSQMCVEMLSPSGKWNDTSCDIQRGYICSSFKIFSNARTAVTPTIGTKEIPVYGDASSISSGTVLGIVLFFLISVILASAAYCYFYPPNRSFRSTSESELCDADL